MNVRMWGKALRVIPRINKQEWDELDIISKWLISTRSAVLVMTFLSSAFAGIFAFRAGEFDLVKWLLVTLGLLLAHATNNLLNDYTDFTRGVDKDNYYRNQYGPQPLSHGLLTKRQLLTYALVTGGLAAAAGVVLIFMQGGYTWLFMVLGAFFVLFYTYPLKYIAMGEIAVLLTWGPLMIGGGYYVITGQWSWDVVLASLPYALGVTGVIFGKHIDKIDVDKPKRIFTLPVLLGEKVSRITVVVMWVLQYVAVAYLVITGFFKLPLLLIFLALPKFFELLPMFRAPKPDTKPDDYPDVWPNYFVASAFVHNRTFGMLFLLGLILDVLWKVFLG